MKKLQSVKIFTSILVILYFLWLLPLPSPAFAAQAVIVLDPGHSSPDKQGQTEPGSEGLKVGDNSGCPGERAAMQTVADNIKKDLTKDGYTVVMTKVVTDSYV